MEILNTIAGFLNKLFQWWFTVMPWEQAILVRRGKHVRLLGAGLYVKIPFIDVVYVQTTRMRMVDTSMQTITTQDGTAVTIKSVYGYRIEDIQKLYNTLYHPEITLGSMVQGAIGEHVRLKNVKDITPESIEATVIANINQHDYGLKDITVKITNFAIVQTYRLIQDQSGIWEGLNMEPKK